MNFVDLLKLLGSLGFGAGVAWVFALVIRLQDEKAKNAQLKVKVVDDDITQKIHLEPDTKLDADLSKRLGPNSDKP